MAFRQTPKDFQIVLWAMILLLLLIGSGCFYFSFHVPAEKPEAAIELRGLSVWSFCFAAAVIAIERAMKAYLR